MEDIQNKFHANIKLQDRHPPRDVKILGWCTAGPVLPHGEKVPL